MKTAMLAVAVLVAGSTAARANEVFLQADLGIHGMQHLCRYSDGNIYSFNATDTCPTSVNLPGFVAGGMTGFLSGQYEDGMTKVCAYNVGGQTRLIRLNAYEVCSPSYTF
jgi:hypothetical protein